MERVKSEIERKLYNYKAMLKRAEPGSEDFYCCRARVAAYEELLIVIKQFLANSAKTCKDEQKPAESKELTEFDKAVGVSIGTWEPKTPEQILAEIDRYEEYLHGFEGSSRDDCISIAKHFAEFGARIMKEQMMKGAVEGKVVAVRTSMSDKLHTYPWIELEAQLSKNDKVKVIIIKE